MKIYFYPCTLDYFLSDNSDLKFIIHKYSANKEGVNYEFLTVCMDFNHIFVHCFNLLA